MKNEMGNIKQYNQMSSYKYKTLVFKDITNRCLTIIINERSNTYIDIGCVDLNGKF